jgi:hypothetical protein
MSSSTSPQSASNMAQLNIPIKNKASQRAKKAANKEHKGSSSIVLEDEPKGKSILNPASNYFSTDSSTAIHLKGTKADFDAITAERPQPSVIPASPVLSTDDLADPGVSTKNVIKEVVKVAPPPKPLTKSFARAAGSSMSTLVTVVHPKGVVSTLPTASGPKRVVSASSKSSSPLTPLSPTFSLTSSRSTASFASAVKGNSFGALQVTVKKAEVMPIPVRKDSDFPLLGDAPVLTSKKAGKEDRAILSPASTTDDGFTTVANKKLAKTKVLQPETIAKKPKAITTIKRAVEPSNSMKLTFVRNNKAGFFPPSPSVLSPSATPAADVEKQPEVWTEVSTKKQSNSTKLTTAATNSSAPILKPHKPIKAAGATDATSTSGKVQVQDMSQIIPPAESTTWMKVQSKKSKKTSNTEQPISPPKQSANIFDKLDRAVKLPSASTTAAKKPRQASAAEVTTISSSPKEDASESTAPAPETQTSGRKKMTRSQRAKQQKQKARERKVKADASSKFSIARILILVLILARRCWSCLA